MSALPRPIFCRGWQQGIRSAGAATVPSIPSSGAGARPEKIMRIIAQVDVLEAPERCHSVATSLIVFSPEKTKPPRMRALWRVKRYWARTSDPQLVELVLSQLAKRPGRAILSGPGEPAREAPPAAGLHGWRFPANARGAPNPLRFEGTWPPSATRERHLVLGAGSMMSGSSAGPLPVSAR